MATIRPVSISAAFFTSANAPDPSLRERVGQLRATRCQITIFPPRANSRFQEDKPLKDLAHPPLHPYSLPTHALVDPPDIMVHLRDRSHGP
jgi:hypothetical protein